MSRHYSIKELAGVALPTGHREGIFVMLKAYFDDSGTHGGSPITGMGGLIGTVAQWERFETAWAAQLAYPVPDRPRLKAFHLSHCAAKDGEFRDYKQVECDFLTAEFRRIIAASGLISTASVIDRKSWDELIVGPIRNILGDALEPCFGNCIDETIRVAKVHPEGRQIAIVFDRGIETERLRLIADVYMRPLGNPWISSVTFAKVEEVLPLQGADMAATESFWHAQTWLAGGNDSDARLHFQDYMKSIRGEGFIIDRAAILAEISRRGPDGLLLEEQPA